MTGVGGSCRRVGVRETGEVRRSMVILDGREGWGHGFYLPLRLFWGLDLWCYVEAKSPVARVPGAPGDNTFLPGGAAEAGPFPGCSLELSRVLSAAL